MDFVCGKVISPYCTLKTKGLCAGCWLLWEVPYGVQSAIEFKCSMKMENVRAMTETNDQQATEEIILPENLLPLGSVLGRGVSPLDACMVLAEVFHAQIHE